MKAVVFTLGCKVNECESDSLISALYNKGIEVSDKLEYADVYIVNTCAVTKEAEKKSRQCASRILKINPKAKIIFTGCASQKCSSAFIKKNPDYLVTGVFEKGKIPEMLDCKGEHIFKQSSEFEELLPPKSMRARTYVKVQDGCNNFCSYCIIPYLRGRSRSRDPQKVLREIAFESPKEAVINGINLTDYNYNGLGLTGLIEALKDVDCRIRLGSLEAGVIDDRFLTALKNLKDFAPHFHLSLQSGSNAVLKKMNRRYTTEQYLEKVNLIRKYFPSAGITTDIIVGFPTETQENFNETMDFIDKVAFSDIHPFIFSPREGTVAYKMVDLPPEVKKERLDVIMVKKHQIKSAFIKSMLNSVREFLCEYTENGYSQGYTGNYLRVYVKGEIASGTMLKVRLIKEYLDGAIAEIIE